MESNEVMLTTTDNPYNPFDQFHSWLLFDKEKGYNTCEYLARIAKLEDDMSQPEKDAEIERAIDEIISYNLLGLLTSDVTYDKVYKTQDVEH